QKEYIAGLVAILGTTISPYLMFWQCSEEVEETADRKAGIRITRTRILGMRVDVIAGMAAAVAIMFAIMVACAYTLGAHGARVIGSMLVLGNRAGAVGRHRSGWLSNLLVGFACLLMTALPLIYLALR